MAPHVLELVTSKPESDGNLISGANSVWQRLKAEPVKPFSRDQFNLWLMLGCQPGGMWEELAAETLLLRPDLMAATSLSGVIDIWEEINDETLILNPPRDLWLELLKIPVAPFQDEGLWSMLGEETLLVAAPQESVWSLAMQSGDFIHQKPIRRLGWALKKLTTVRGEEYYILKNLRQGAYMRLTEQQVFLWNLLDGENTVQDMAVAFFMQYQCMAVQGLIVFLGQLETNGFLVRTRTNLYAQTAYKLGQGRMASLGKKIWRLFAQTTFSIRNLDRPLTAIYKAGVFLVYTWLVQLLLLLVTLAGMAAFIYHLSTGAFSVLTGGGENVALGLVALYIAIFLTAFLHESAHAFTTKHYGREVRKAGFMIYLGSPAFFVDTTDIWMEPRRPRLMVSWAGPYSGFFLAGLASLLIFVSGSPFVSGLLYQFAFICTLTSFTNLNPLLKLDGYYILMDWLEMPQLLARAQKFVQSELWQKLRRRETFGREERIFSVYGLLSLVWTGVAILMGLKLIGSALLGFLQGLLGQVLGLALTGLLVVALAVVMLWPMAQGLLKRRAGQTTV